VYLERRICQPRHIEIQLLGDHHGEVVAFVERECSIQRRHQKVVEETPSPALGDDQRRRLCAAGVAAARAASYVNAGTVEFLLDPSGAFYFLEMNTRLQVEHPVTECITGLDLVRLQIEVAAGRPLALNPAAIVARGHALECRLSAEDPWNGDLPSPGRILHCVPPDGPGVRFDGGIAAGSEVSVHYDPLLAKVITWGASRDESIERMADALRRTVVLGVVTNLERLQAIVDHPAFRRGELHTGFLEEHLASLERVPCPPPEGLAAAVLALSRSSGSAARGARTVADPWESLGGWRLA
jgi:3-methylcrotonyl-CoA carboxylase alpha subunit